jgi:hypothetical protein
MSRGVGEENPCIIEQNHKCAGAYGEL